MSTSVLREGRGKECWISHSVHFDDKQQFTSIILALKKKPGCHRCPYYNIKNYSHYFRCTIKVHHFSSVHVCGLERTFYDVVPTNVHNIAPCICHKTQSYQMNYVHKGVVILLSDGLVNQFLK